MKPIMTKNYVVDVKRLLKMDKKKILFFIIPILVLIAQITKRWALKNIFEKDLIIEINQYLNFVSVWNKGISFGLLSNFENINFFMIILTGIILIFIFLWMIKATNLNLSISLSLIISGAIGNLIDRFNHKAVVDFIDIHINAYHWPAFNLADSYITIGAFLYIFVIFTSQNNNIA